MNKMTQKKKSIKLSDSDKITLLAYSNPTSQITAKPAVGTAVSKKPLYNL